MQTALSQTGTVQNRQKQVPMNRQTQAALKMYKNEQVMNLSPVEIIKRSYDLTIIACKKDDTEKALRILRELTVALNFEQGDFAVQLFHIYQYCIKCLRENNTEEVISILEGLRSTWIEAFKL